jgi:hypothetical protein
MVQDGGIGNSLIWAPTDEPPHMGGSLKPFAGSLKHAAERVSSVWKRLEEAMPSGTSDI